MKLLNLFLLQKLKKEIFKCWFQIWITMCIKGKHAIGRIHRGEIKKGQNFSLN